MEFVNAFLDAIRFDLYDRVLDIIWIAAPAWVPIVLLIIWGRLWMNYVQSLSIFERGSVLLEIKLPREITKSPAAMEVFFSQIYQTGSNTEIDTFWGGKIRPWFSLEMISEEGKVRFFIWMSEPRWKNFVEAQLYAQYPTIEIYEVLDYTTLIHHNLDKWFMWITYFKLTGEDPLPIKTYVDYGLDKDPKEEYKIDPISAAVEYLGSLGKGEYSWIQILIQAHKKEKLKDGRLIPKEDWKLDAKKMIEKIRADSTPKFTDDSGKERSGFPNPTPGQIDTIKALERSISKFPFEVAIRAGYLAKNENMTPIRINGLIASFKQYNSQDLNGFRLGAFTDFDYPWQDFKRIRRTALEKRFLEAYKRRSFFNPPFKNYLCTRFILNSEELATIFHLPGGVVQTPTLERIGSRKAEAPPNLPR
ncbi:MAG: hypothetical protein Q8P52_03305 [bacterium]|nr:hypothetical protein [bacterium]